MRKAIVLILVLSMLLSLASCDMFFENVKKSASNTDGSTSVTTTQPPHDQNGCIDYIGYWAHGLEEYETLLATDYKPYRDNFVHLDQISGWSTFVEFHAEGSARYTMDDEYEYYFFTDYDRYMVRINHVEKDIYSQSTGENCIVLSAHPEDDFRTCSYTEGDAIYVENDIAYYYTKGNLRFICWMYNDIMFTIENPEKPKFENGGYIPSDFKDFMPWRSLPSLFMNRVSANRAIEFFDLAFKGELPTIEEVFGDTTEPCEITWQKPE